MAPMPQGRVVDHAEWSTMAVPDIYFSLGYHLASGTIEPDFHEAVLVEWSDDQGVVRMPLLLRKIPGTEFLDATSAYDYGGPWIEGTPDLAAFFAYLNDWAHEYRVVCTFLRFHPLLKNAEAVSPFIPVRKVGVTFGWDLAQDRDLVAGMSHGHRSRYRKALRDGMKMRITAAPKDISSFRDIYEQTMDRLSAREFYYFPESYWTSLQENLGEDLVLAEVIYQDHVAAAALFLIGENYLHYHLSGTSDLGRTKGASVFSNTSIARHAREKGFEVMHMGGGPGGETSTLVGWKHDFDTAAELHDFHVGEILHDADAFETLSADSGDKEFFPPWRARRVSTAS